MRSAFLVDLVNFNFVFATVNIYISNFSETMNPPKKRKTGDECRVFNEEWTNKYFFGNTGNKAVCLLCHEMQS
jgi:hypothetical protein